MAPGYHATYSTAWRHYAYLLPPPPNATRAAVAAEAAALDKLLRPLAGTQPAQCMPQPAQYMPQPAQYMPQLSTHRVKTLHTWCNMDMVHACLS